jgi:hypothetical protein
MADDGLLPKASFRECPSINARQAGLAGLAHEARCLPGRKIHKNKDKNFTLGCISLYLYNFITDIG